jgi:hypothetical protein
LAWVGCVILVAIFCHLANEAVIGSNAILDFKVRSGPLTCGIRIDEVLLDLKRLVDPKRILGSV